MYMYYVYCDCYIRHMSICIPMFMLKLMFCLGPPFPKIHSNSAVRDNHPDVRGCDYYFTNYRFEQSLEYINKHLMDVQTYPKRFLPEPFEAY